MTQKQRNSHKAKQAAFTKHKRKQKIKFISSKILAQYPRVYHNKRQKNRIASAISLIKLTKKILKILKVAAPRRQKKLRDELALFAWTKSLMVNGNAGRSVLPVSLSLLGIFKFPICGVKYASNGKPLNEVAPSDVFIC